MHSFGVYPNCGMMLLKIYGVGKPYVVIATSVCMLERSGACKSGKKKGEAREWIAKNMTDMGFRVDNYRVWD